MTDLMRMAEGGDLDRSKRLSFTFDGRACEGFAGDTVASALLANGIRIVARSFKYHRPRGVYSAGPEEPSAILDLRLGTRHDPNARATLEPLADGMELRSIHAQGTAEHDRLGFLDSLSRFIPSAFYYKTFMWPNWGLYEPRIRALAGLGRVDGQARATSAVQRHAQVDVCVIGAGPAGLSAAVAAVRQGKRVMLVEAQPRLGGTLRHRELLLDDLGSTAWVNRAEQALGDGGVQILRSAVAFGLYDHNVVGIAQRDVAQSANDERMWLVRAAQIVVAAGAIERPLLFQHNDRPGIMRADAALAYLRRYAVKLGQKIVVATNNDSAYEVADAFKAAGSDVTLVDSRPSAEIDPVLAEQARAAGFTLRPGARINAAIGKRAVEAVTLSDGSSITADFVATSSGWSPSLHLYCHSKGRPEWDEVAGTFRAGNKLPGIHVVGAAAGIWDFDALLQQAVGAVGGTDAPRARGKVRQWTAPTQAPAPGVKGKRIWIDLQNDVTVADIELAVRENFSAVEHLKRYTTLGMGTDQGKTSNINGLAVLSSRLGREQARIGTTTFRPPFVPVSMATIAAAERGPLQAPIRRLPIETLHRQEGAHFRDYGGVLRPAWYGARTAIADECAKARNGVVILDASSLGKIEVIGPATAALLDFVYYTPMSNLKVGRARYGLCLTEGGVVADDGVIVRLAPEHFVVSCSSSHVAFMVANLEAWRQDHFDLKQVFIHDATSHWATLAISGPRSKQVLESLALGVELNDTAFPHMSVALGRFDSRAARIARVSFTGERSYEVSVPAGLAAQLWQRARSAGASPIGIEALSILRAEKGYLYVGQDTDGETMPHDLGFGGPRGKRQDSFVGDRSLFTPAASAGDRKQLVGIAAEGNVVIPTGASAIARDGGKNRILGYVTSSYMSNHLGRPIALGLIENGAARLNETVAFQHLGQGFAGRIVAPCFLDPEGTRLNA
jgi:sarcosine oxidase subunit alpha